MRLARSVTLPTMSLRFDWVVNQQLPRSRFIGTPRNRTSSAVRCLRVRSRRGNRPVELSPWDGTRARTGALELQGMAQISISRSLASTCRSLTSAPVRRLTQRIRRRRFVRRARRRRGLKTWHRRARRVRAELATAEGRALPARPAVQRPDQRPTSPARAARGTVSSRWPRARWMRTSSPRSWWGG